MQEAIHFIECMYVINGRKSFEWLPRDPERTGLKNTIQDIIDGQIEPDRIVRILECTPGEICRDVTEDIARAVADQCYHEQVEISWAMKNFLHDQLGVQSTRQLIEA